VAVAVAVVTVVTALAINSSKRTRLTLMVPCQGLLAAGVAEVRRKHGGRFDRHQGLEVGGIKPFESWQHMRIQRCG
jgi:hypothetical protein